MTPQAEEKQHNYYKKLLEMIRNGKVGQDRGAVTITKVKHDPWCAFYLGKYCDCNPEIEID